MIKLKPVFLIRVIYKSGYYHDFEVFKFTVKGGSYTWEWVSDRNRPIDLGADEIAAVYQIGYRRKLVFGWK